MACKPISIFQLCAAVLAFSTLAPASLSSQNLPPESGTVGAGLLLRQLDGAKRVLMIGAHPDDEDTSLLAAMARGVGAETAYLALNRGEGGQNLIGPEFHDGLGIVRTGELLAARRLDGGRQFFTRAYDFGFSKSAEETFGYWSREDLLRDVVWVIRTYRPHVIVSVFTGTPRDGHGQHQAAGQLAHEAFDVAADPARFPDQFEDGAVVWQPSKLYISRRFNPNEASTFVETGALDPLLGRSYHQLAMESRSQHRSQDMGTSQPLGPRVAGMALVKSAVGDLEIDEAPFASIDTTLASLVGELPSSIRADVAPLIQRYRIGLASAWESLDALDPGAAVPPLADATVALHQAMTAVSTGAPDTELARVLKHKMDIADGAVMAASSVVLDVRVDDDLAVPGERINLTFQLWNGGDFPIRSATPEALLPAGWAAELTPDRSGVVAEASQDIAPGGIGRWVFAVDVPEDADLSKLYYLKQARDSETYPWPDQPELWGLPKDPPPVFGRISFDLDIGNREMLSLSKSKGAEFVGVEQSFGEFRNPLLVVPAVSVSLEPAGMVWPLTSTDDRPITVHLRHESSAASSGTIRLETPDGWEVEPATLPFDFTGAGQESSLVFQVRPTGGLDEGFHTLRAVATLADGREYREGYALVDYPHIDRVAQFHASETVVSVFPVEIAEDVSIGYIMGSGDGGPEALRQMGFLVEELSPDQVLSGDFSRFTTLVLGVRVYETRPDVLAANDQLLQFVREGGTLISQYNQYSYPSGNYAPYPVSISRPHDRVTDETAEVTLLHPEAPLFSGPNKIGDRDFQGWIQERGLYFLGEWDDAFVPLMEMADPGEDPKRGALLVAPVGEGVYVYTGLAFFRQFPRGVPGPFRLFANLASLKPEVWRAWAAGVVF